MAVEIVLNILIIVLTALAAIISGFYEIKEIQGSKTVFTTAGKIFIVVTIGASVLTGVKLSFDLYDANKNYESQLAMIGEQRKLTEQHLNDSITNLHNDLDCRDRDEESRKKIDSLYIVIAQNYAHTNAKLDSTKDPIPTLSIINKPTISPDKSTIDLFLTSLRTESHLIDYRYIVLPVLNTPNRTLEILGHRIIAGSSFNETTVLPVEFENPLSLFYTKNGLDKLSTFVLALEFNYKTQQGQIRPPLRKMYIVYPDQKIDDCDTWSYKFVDEYLRHHKIWK